MRNIGVTMAVLIGLIILGNIFILSPYKKEIKNYEILNDRLSKELEGVRGEKQNLESLLVKEELKSDSLTWELREKQSKLDEISDKYIKLQSELEQFTTDDHIAFYAGILTEESGRAVISQEEYPRSIVLDGVDYIMVVEWQIEQSNYMFVELFEKREKVILQQEVIGGYVDLVESLRGEINTNKYINEFQKREISILENKNGLLREENDFLIEDINKKKKGIYVRNILIGVAIVAAIVF